MLSQEVVDRFHSKALKASNGCILWTAGKFKDGYGGFWALGKMHRAHRVAWELVNGPIRDCDMQVLHRCDNPICVNTDHLFLGTLVENMRDRDDKGRGLSGENCNRAKLKTADIKMIRQSSLPAAKLANLYGVTHSAICYVRRGDTWKDI